MIPHILHHVWVGPRPVPMQWINTWREKHPDWEHVLWGNDAVKNGGWENQKQIDYYYRIGEWPGVADLLRYEILHRHGGFNPGVDSLCHLNIDELMDCPDYDLFSCWENERAKPGLISPVHGSTSNNPYLAQIIAELGRLKPPLGKPWKTTGNLYMGEFFARQKPGRFRIFPSHYFMPHHWTGLRYEGDGKIYGEHLWGTTKRLY